MRIKEPIDNIVILMIIVQSLLYIFFFPNLENPDGLFFYSLVKDGKADSPYFYVLIELDKFLINNLNIDDYQPLLTNPDFGFFNWESLLIHESYNFWSVMLLQIFNVVLILLVIMIFHFLLKKSNKLVLKEKKMLYRVCLLYFLYPSVAYLVIGITADIPIYLYQPFFILLLFLKKHIINIFLLIILYFYFDGGAIINIYFLIFFVVLSTLFKMKIKKPIVLASVPLLVGVIYLFSNYILVGSFEKSMLIEVMQYSRNYNENFLTKIVYFILTASYLPGQGGYITFPGFYFLFSLILLIIYYRSFKSSSTMHNKNLFNLLMVSLLTISSLLILYPIYAHIKYYMFFIIIILLGCFSTIFNDKNFISDKKYLLFSFIIFLHNSILTIIISIKTFIL